MGESGVSLWGARFYLSDKLVDRVFDLFSSSGRATATPADYTMSLRDMEHALRASPPAETILGRVRNRRAADFLSMAADQSVSEPDTSRTVGPEKVRRLMFEGMSTDSDEAREMFARALTAEFASPDSIPIATIDIVARLDAVSANAIRSVAEQTINKLVPAELDHLYASLEICRSLGLIVNCRIDDMVGSRLGPAPHLPDPSKRYVGGPATTRGMFITAHREDHDPYETEKWTYIGAPLVDISGAKRPGADTYLAFFASTLKLYGREVWYCATKTSSRSGWINMDDAEAFVTAFGHAHCHGDWFIPQL